MHLVPMTSHRAFLQELAPKALTELLEIFNDSSLHADIPQFWRHGIIIPILKAGKPASDVDSYRPISLTSCMVKLLERMISNRLNTMAENRIWLVNEQAGFRRGLSCEDQIIKLVQKVSDGFELKPHLRTVMASFEYSKAYDRTSIRCLILAFQSQSHFGWPHSYVQGRHKC